LQKKMNTLYEVVFEGLRDVEWLKEKLWFDDEAKARLERVSKTLLWVTERFVSKEEIR